MLESFKKIFRNAKEINNDPFFDKLESPKIEKQKEEIKNEIPIDSLLIAISKHGECSYHPVTDWEYFKATVKIDKNRTVCVEIDKYNQYVFLEQWSENLKTSLFKFSFKLKKEEINALKTAIKQKSEEERIEKVKNARQGIENVLQGILK